MTIEECTNQLDELLNCEDGLIDYIRREARRLMESGGIDLSSHNRDSFAPAKIILTVVLENAAEQYRPLDRNWREDAANLRHF